MQEIIAAASLPVQPYGSEVEPCLEKLNTKTYEKYEKRVQEKMICCQSNDVN